MAKRRTGVFGTLGNLIRWTVWGLAAVLVVAIVLNFTGEDDTVIVADGGDQPVDEVLAAGDTEEAVSDAVEEQLEAATGTEVPDSAAEAVADAADAAAEAENAVTEAETALADAVETLEATTEGAVAEAEAAVREAVGDVVAATSEAETAAETALDEANAAIEDAAAEGAVTDEEADLNILPTDVESFQVPGDPATYSLLSVFERDDGTIEVVTERAADGVSLQTTRLVTCAPFAVGTVQEGDGPRNDAPELERIPLGSAAASIAALACGIVN